MTGRSHQVIRLIGPLIAVGLFTAALWVLHHELAGVSLERIQREFHAIPREHLVWASLLTVLSYLILTGHDLIATRAAGARLSYPKTALASFIGYTLSHNLGFSILTGTAARYRLFSAWGISPQTIAQALAVSAIVFWVGFLFLFGLLGILVPSGDLHLQGIMAISPKLGSSLALGLVIAVYLFALSNRTTISVFGFEFSLPRARILGIGTAVASIDWLVASAVAYVILAPPNLSFFEFAFLFQLGQLAGLLSHVPGGVGVFEAVIVTFLSPHASPEQIAGALLAYRLIYYLIPLAVGGLLLVSYEIWSRRAFAMGVARPIVAGITGIAPIFSAVFTFTAGVALLLGAVRPPHDRRFHFFSELVPLPVLEASHFTSSIVGLGLIMVSLGLRRRLDGAFYFALVGLAIGTILSLIRGVSVEEFVFLTFVLVLVASSRSNFYRKSRLTSDFLDPIWLVALLCVLAASFGVLFFSFKNVPYGHELWWQFAFDAHAPRALRAIAGVLIVVFLSTLHFLLRPPPTPKGYPTRAEIEEIAPAVISSRSTYANLAYLGDKMFLTNSSKNAFIMYAVQGSSWIALGDPIGPETEAQELIWTFKELCDTASDIPVFYQVNPKYLPYYIDAGFSLLKLGSEAIVNLNDFTIQGRARNSLRHSYRRPEKEGLVFEVVSPPLSDELLSTLKQISDDWLERKSTREKGFSLGFFAQEYLRRCPAALVRKNDQIVAFANLWCGADKEELSVDLMRYSSQAPVGVMDYLFVTLMLWGKEQGYKTFNLGMAPLSGLEQRQLAPLWNKIGNLLFRHGEHFYNFQGILAYKEKYKPYWEPRYLAYPHALKLPIIFTNLSSAIGGGIRGVLTK